ncbi:MAG: flagellar filament capping protein FliD [Lachnospiraceae bacterium]
MAFYYGISSDSVSTLFSSLGNTSNTQSNILAEYASIKNGSYYKLAKAYYSKADSTDSSSGSKQSTNKLVSSVSDKERAQALNEVKSSSDRLAESLEGLVSKGKDSVFTKVSQTGADGKTTEGYDVNKIYEAVSSFVRNYNDAYTAASSSTVSSISSTARSMYNSTTANQKLLSELGITLDSDNKLQLDEQTFRNADMQKAQSLFSGNGSYGYAIKLNASYASISATNAANQDSLYGSNGTYTKLNQVSAFEGLF